MTSPTPVWALNETAGSALSIAKGLIKAASSDNVQALALISCRAFGGTLAMCQETCMKVERIAAMRHVSASVKFLKAHIGYSSGDSAAQLSLDASGVRFLALAAALSTIGAFPAAVALESMLASSAQDPHSLPTVTHLKDLLLALDHKLNRAGFTDHLVGWTTWFMKNASFCRADKEVLKLRTAASPQEVELLVKALREVARLGDATEITVTAGATAPWVTAFIKWVLGMPPSIILKDGTPLLEQSGSNITLIVIPSRAVFGMTEIVISRQMDTPIELIEARSGQEPWTGMVTLQGYAHDRLQRLDLNSGLATRAVYQALPYALKQAWSLLQADWQTEQRDLPSPKATDTSESSHIPGNAVPSELDGIRGCMFDTESVLARLLSRFIGEDVASPLPVLSEGTLISDLPLIRLYKESLQRDCKCSQCQIQSPSAATYRICNWIVALESISSLVADLLALSLLDCTEPVMLLIRRSERRLTEGKGFDVNVFDTLLSGTPSLCIVSVVVQHTLSILGHNWLPTEKEGSWVMSSYRGQTFYPRLFETQTLSRQGLLVMSGAPGLLRYEKTVYQRVVAASPQRVLIGGTPDTITSKLRDLAVQGPLNLLSEHSVTWQVTVGDGVLYASIQLTASPATFEPFKIIRAAAGSLYVESCPHIPHAQLAEADGFAEYRSPFFPRGEPQAESDKVGVIPVHGSESLRMFSLVSGEAAVVQQRACLQCSLDVCRKAGYRFVIDGRLRADENVHRVV